MVLVGGEAVQILLKEKADLKELIESLHVQLAEANKRIETKEILLRMQETTMSMLSSDKATVVHQLWDLKEKLTESQRREQAAVEDLTEAGACFSCKRFLRNGGNCSGGRKCLLYGMEIFPCDEPDAYRVEVPDDGRDTYEWRGPQAVKGEAG